VSERGKARYTFISAGSNTSVATGARTLYRVLSSNPAGSTIRVEDGDIGQSPNWNGTGDTDTIYLGGGALLDFGPGVGVNSQINVAATSNARLTIVWE
jgi:hypothetical protein